MITKVEIEYTLLKCLGNSHMNKQKVTLSTYYCHVPHFHIFHNFYILAVYEQLKVPECSEVSKLVSDYSMLQLIRMFLYK